jgi:hypothetical protein
VLKYLSLDNFKAFGSPQTVPLAPITLIFGANSAGKSSILQALLVLKQTSSQPESAGAILSPKGSLVDLGSFRELIFRHDVRRTCSITPLFTPDDFSGRHLSALFRYDIASTVVGTGFRFKFDHAEGAVRIKDIGVFWDNPLEPLLRLVPAQPLTEPDQSLRGMPTRTAQKMPGSPSAFMRVAQLNRTHALWERLYSQWEQPRRERMTALEASLDPSRGAGKAEWERVLIRSLRARGAPAAENIRNRLAHQSGSKDFEPLIREHLKKIQEEIRRLKNYTLGKFIADVRKQSSGSLLRLRHFIPDAPIRTVQRPDAFESPGMSRDLPIPDMNQLSLWICNALREQLNDIVYLGPLREYPERHYIFSGNVAREVGKSGRMLADLLFKRTDLVHETNAVLQEFDIGYTVNVQRVRDRHVEDVFALRLIDDKSGTTVSMLDVGFGISQVLPIIVQSMLSHGNTILIEQPEIHLHPKLQAALGTLLAKGIRSPRNNQFLVETHSEHLMLRIQRLIREGTLHPADVSVLYVTREEDGSHCYSLRLDDEGDFIDEWPEGFFEEGFREIFSVTA